MEKPKLNLSSVKINLVGKLHDVVPRVYKDSTQENKLTIVDFMTLVAQSGSVLGAVTSFKEKVETSLIRHSAAISPSIRVEFAHNRLAIMVRYFFFFFMACNYPGITSNCTLYYSTCREKYRRNTGSSKAGRSECLPGKTSALEIRESQ